MKLTTGDIRNIESRPMRRGFTLIELMIVLAVIGVVAAIIVPAILKHRCNSRWNDAGYAEEVRGKKCVEDPWSDPPVKKYDAVGYPSEAPVERPMWSVVCFTSDGTQQAHYVAVKVEFISNPAEMVRITEPSGKEVFTNLQCLAREQ
jgi:prepilin-type N-terminal cleavage/methylation domain-containing protein